jgi:poly(A) polymerase
MIRKFIDKLLGKTSAETVDTGAPKPDPAPSQAARVPLGKRVEIAAADHGIDPTLVDERAVRVVLTLQQAGYTAYVVGGAVRDLLVGRRPKDFDVATNATPEQVKGLFRRAFIIGRRFRIVHVIHGRGRDHEVIEVSTFRAQMDGAAAEPADSPPPPRDGAKSHVVDASGRVLRDNVWGPQIEDAARRDFTVNAMYYDPATRIVVDYHGGFKDIRAGLLRMIGDPDTRYREDPVRILRVVRFAAKLGFKIESRTEKPLRSMASLLGNVPSSRLFDEMIKLLQTGHARRSLDTLKALGLDRGIFPVLDAVLAQMPAGSPREQFVHLALDDTDRRVAEDKPVAPSFMLACLLWHDVCQRRDALVAQGESAGHALGLAIDAVFDARIGDISGRGKLALDMREIWAMQPRFERRAPSAALALVEQPRFRAAFDFLRLRADSGEADAALAEWWEDFSLGDEAERESMLEAVREAGRPKRQAGAVRSAEPRAPHRSEGDEPPADAAGEGDTDDDEGASAEEGLGAEGANGPARKRRRRRRKPAGARPAPGGEGSGPAAQ